MACDVGELCMSPTLQLGHARVVRDLNLACMVGSFFSATVNGLTDYVIKHHFLKGKYDIITMPPFLEKMHRYCKPFFWVPGQVLGRLGCTRIHIIASDKMLSDQNQDKILDLFYYILEISLSGHVF